MPDSSSTSSDPPGGEYQRLDAMGLLCPLPIVLTERQLRGLEVGERLEVIGDDPGILEDMPVFCDDSGHRLVEIGEERGVVRCVVEKR